MRATELERPAAAFAAVSLAAMIVAFAIGEARAQPVNPPIVMPPPTFNPSTPYTVPQPPPARVSPTLPSGLSGSAPAISPAVVLPRSENRQAAKAHTAPKRARMHVRHHREVRMRRHRRRARFHRVLGPSYYPGRGEFYPPYPNPCHFIRVWSGYYAGQWDTYTCSW